MLDSGTHHAYRRGMNHRLLVPPRCIRCNAKRSAGGYRCNSTWGYAINNLWVFHPCVHFIRRITLAQRTETC